MLLLLDLVAVVESQILCFMFLVVSSVSSLFTFLFSPRKHNLVIVLIDFGSAFYLVIAFIFSDLRFFPSARTSEENMIEYLCYQSLTSGNVE